MKVRVSSIATSRHKGTPKSEVKEALLTEDHGLEGDAHAGAWHRQVSLLASERIEEAREGGLDVSFGDFAENIATVGIDWKTVMIGSRFLIGESAVIEITQIGKECHGKCAVYYRNGDCIMPREGVFARVIHSGRVRKGDSIEALEGSTTA